MTEGVYICAFSFSVFARSSGLKCVVRAGFLVRLLDLCVTLQCWVPCQCHVCPHHNYTVLFCNTIHASVGFFKLQLSLLYVYIHYIV